MEYAFTQDDVGCYADGANGSEHRRAVLAEMLAGLTGLGTAEAVECANLIKELAGEPSDDYSEEDNAIAILQEHTEPGLVWLMHDGDLVLCDEKDTD